MSQRNPRSYMRAPLLPQNHVAVNGMRQAGVKDIPALSKLLLSAYLGTIDQEEETEAEALIEIEKTFNGEHGPFVPECSMVMASGEELLSAALVTRWQGRPFLAFSMTNPNHKRKGLARACLVATMEELRSRGEQELRLVVTLANNPAKRLYESLGFVLSE